MRQVVEKMVDMKKELRLLALVRLSYDLATGKIKENTIGLVGTLGQNPLLQSG